MKIVLVSLLIFFCQVSQAQQQHACGHAEMEELLLQKHPALLHERAALEQFTATYTAHRQQRVLSDTILFIIPVVFHIMHNYGEENISREQIVDAVRIMNEYYQKRNADTAQIIPLFQPLIGDVRLEFRLAQLDPQGNCTDGITRHQTYLTNGGNDLLKSILQWPPDRYLNIWVEKNTLNSFSAYAYLPGAPPALDGIVVTHPYVGSIGTAQGSSSIAILAHEAGHYFNLLHTWGPTNTPGLASNCSLDDQVFDTPNCIGGVCNLNAPGCIAGEISNVQNIMDYCFEQMFTLGQVTRMQAALNAPTGN
ncbi:MAG TPA: M43 family zinc metalloprotease, partial [Bacteroidia bacterium]|nr:M43 family zinc metalloprotease [Bacteroidia bacterium]